MALRNLAAVALGLAVGLANVMELQALSKSYELANPIGDVSAHSSGDGLLIKFSVGDNPGAFYLEDGASKSFEFFNIWTEEATVNQDDRVPKSITATLVFVDPNTSQMISGVTVGGSFFFGLAQWGEVQWDEPAVVEVDGDREFKIELSDEVFNFGFFGLGKHGATVSATITQISSSVSVPDGGLTLVMLGAGCFVLGAVRQRFAR